MEFSINSRYAKDLYRTLYVNTYHAVLVVIMAMLINSESAQKGRLKIAVTYNSDTGIASSQSH